VPQLNTPENFSSAPLLKNDGLKLICALNSTQSITSLPAPKKVTLLIGPEGGFTTEEVKLATENGFKCFPLGPRTLRTETATVTAISIAGFVA
jgi:16S rRNA (uracil1498-N3)-methyltransferase